MLREYYSTTTMDTEVIVRSVIQEYDESKSRLLYHALKKSRSHTWPAPIPPVAYVAQSPYDAFIKIVVKADMESAACSRSFDETVEIAHEYVSLQVVCFYAEEKVQIFKT